MGRTHAKVLVGITVSYGMDPTPEQGKNVRGPPSEEEGVAEKMCDVLTATPTPHLPLLLGRTRQKNQKLNQAWEKGWRRRYFISHYLILI